jgi:hypothetical protein
MRDSVLTIASEYDKLLLAIKLVRDDLGVCGDDLRFGFE